MIIDATGYLWSISIQNMRDSIQNVAKSYFESLFLYWLTDVFLFGSCIDDIFEWQEVSHWNQDVYNYKEFSGFCTQKVAWIHKICFGSDRYSIYILKFSFDDRIHIFGEKLLG